METRYKIIINDVSEEFITTLIEKGYIVERFDINEELVKASEVEKEIVETKIARPLMQKASRTNFSNKSPDTLAPTIKPKLKPR